MCLLHVSERRLQAKLQATSEIWDVNELQLQLAKYASANAKTEVHYGCRQIYVTWHIAAVSTRH